MKVLVLSFMAALILKPATQTDQSIFACFCKRGALTARVND